MIVFGWQTEYETLEKVLTTQCPHCQQETQRYILKGTEWASLFFIKIFRLFNKYFISCDHCRWTVPINNDMAEAALDPNRRSDTLYDALLTAINTKPNYSD